MIVVKETCPDWIGDWRELAEMTYGEEDNEYFTDKTYSCPKCGMPYTFYYTLPATTFCTACFQEIPNVNLIMTSKNYRLKYHFGIINDQGREVH